MELYRAQTIQYFFNYYFNHKKNFLMAYNGSFITAKLFKSKYPEEEDNNTNLPFKYSDYNLDFDQEFFKQIQSFSKNFNSDPFGSSFEKLDWAKDEVLTLKTLIDLSSQIEFHSTDNIVYDVEFIQTNKKVECLFVNDDDNFEIVGLIG